jgi:hypothetical protein
VNRGLWFLAGAGAGVWGMVRGRRAAEAFTAEGLHDRMGALFLGARLLRDEVAQATADRETELRARFAVVPHGRQLGPGGLETGAERPPRPSTKETSS